LAVRSLEIWIGLTATASVAALAYLGYLQSDNSKVTYNEIDSRLATLEQEWSTLSPAGQSPAAFEHFVTQCEEVLATQGSGAAQEMKGSMQVRQHIDSDNDSVS
jgi:hypothetical protein